MTRKNESITLAVSTREKIFLEQLAVKFDMMWGEQPNISKLFRAIASGQLTLNWKDDADAIEFAYSDNTSQAFLRQKIEELETIISQLKAIANSDC